MWNAILVTFSKSFCAPVEIRANVIFSAARPPNAIPKINERCQLKEIYP